MKQISITITTYKRPRQLDRLVTQLQFAKTQWEEKNPKESLVLFIHTIVDDEGNNKFLHFTPMVDSMTEVQFMDRNYGKKGYWAVFNTAYQCHKYNRDRYKIDHFLFLQDDLQVQKDFFERLFKVRRDTQRMGARVINLLTDGGRTNTQIWGSKKSQFLPAMEVWNADWIDCNLAVSDEFIRRFRGLRAIPKSRWTKNPLLGSGVGQQLTEYCRKAGFRMLLPIRSLTRHEDNESLLNPEARKEVPLVADPEEIVTKVTFEGKEVLFYVDDPADHIESKWMAGNFYESQRNGLLPYVYNKGLGREGIIVDCGAHKGNHSLFWLSVMAAHKVYAFEPMNYDALVNNLITLNKYRPSKLWLGRMAVSNYAGKGKMKMPSNGHHDGMYELTTVIGDTIVTTLDSCLPADLKIDVLKIDVERSELKVLKGAKETLKRVKHILVECEDQDRLAEMDKFLAPYGILRHKGVKLNHTPTYHYEQRNEKG